MGDGVAATQAVHPLRHAVLAVEHARGPVLGALLRRNQHESLEGWAPQRHYGNRTVRLSAVVVQVTI